MKLLESARELSCRRQRKARFALDRKFSERVGSSLSLFTICDLLREKGPYAEMVVYTSMMRKSNIFYRKLQTGCH